MRVAAFGLIVAALLAAGLTDLKAPDRAQAQQPSSQKRAASVTPPRVLASAGTWLAFAADTGGGATQITLLDAKRAVMSVYHVDRASGVIELKSVRKIEQDLQIEEFNAASPLPRDIRALLEQR